MKQKKYNLSNKNNNESVIYLTLSDITGHLKNRRCESKKMI